MGKIDASRNLDLLGDLMRCCSDSHVHKQIFRSCCSAALRRCEQSNKHNLEYPEMHERCMIRYRFWQNIGPFVAQRHFATSIWLYIPHIKRTLSGVKITSPVPAIQTFFS